MRILEISDLHFPCHHPGAIDFLADLKREIKPDAVVCIGDELDAHGWSRHERLPDAPGQGDELKMAKVQFAILFKVFSELMVCESNHQLRHEKAAVRGGLPKAFLKNFGDVIDAPKKWRWASHWIVDGVLHVHGDGYSGPNAALTAAKTNRRSTVIGHVHSHAGVQYHSNGFDVIWGMNVGCLIDVDSYGMLYAKTSRDKATLGTGFVIDGEPHFRPLKG